MLTWRFAPKRPGPALVRRNLPWAILMAVAWLVLVGLSQRAVPRFSWGEEVSPAYLVEQHRWFLGRVAFVPWAILVLMEPWRLIRVYYRPCANRIGFGSVATQIFLAWFLLFILSEEVRRLAPIFVLVWTMYYWLRLHTRAVAGNEIPPADSRCEASESAGGESP